MLSPFGGTDAIVTVPGAWEREPRRCGRVEHERGDQNDVSLAVAAMCLCESHGVLMLHILFLLACVSVCGNCITSGGMVCRVLQGVGNVLGR